MEKELTEYIDSVFNRIRDGYVKEDVHSDSTQIIKINGVKYVKCKEGEPCDRIEPGIGKIKRLIKEDINLKVTHAEDTGDEYIKDKKKPGAIKETITGELSKPAENVASNVAKLSEPAPVLTRLDTNKSAALEIRRGMESLRKAQAIFNGLLDDEKYNRKDYNLSSADKDMLKKIDRQVDRAEALFVETFNKVRI